MSFRKKMRPENREAARALVAGRRRLSEAQRKEIARLYKDGTRVPEIAALVGCGVTTAYRVLSETASLTPRRMGGRRKYRYRLDLFAEPLTEAELWLLGLLMADGNVSRRRARITLGLAARDLDAVKTARRVAGSDAPIVLHEPSGVNPLGIRSGAMAVWQLCSREVVSRVTALGMTPGKSYREDVHVPPAVALSPSFWRGLIDGDGTVRLNRFRDGDKTREDPWLQVLGSRALLEQWAAFVVASIGGPSPGLRPIPGTRVLYGSTVTCSRAWDMVEMVYGQGGPALERKREAALEILTLPRQVPRRTASELIAVALHEIGKLSLHDLPATYVCPRTGVRLGRVLEGARRGGRSDLHELFDRHDPGWRIPSRPAPRRVLTDLVERALSGLGKLPLREVPDRYVCPRTGVRLGRVLRRARHGVRSDLCELFDRHDPEWRTATRPPRGIAVGLVQEALVELGDLALHDVPVAYVCARTGVHLGRLLSDARCGGRRDLHHLFASHDPDWRTPRRPGPKGVAVELVEMALEELGNLPLREVPRRFVCSRTGVHLGDLLAGARRGRRPDLHELLDRHDPGWRAPARPAADVSASGR